MNIEQYFYKIKTPVYKQDNAYHLVVCIDKKNRKFVANFLSGLDSLYYKKNITAKTLKELMIKLYKLKGEKQI